LRGLVKRVLRIILVVVVVLLFVLGGLYFWYTHRPLPAEVQQTLFQGISFERDVRSQPRPLVIQVVTVDLDAPGIGFLVTPGEPGQDLSLRARKTSQFLAEFDVQMAVNGDFAVPFYTHFPWDYYPRVGDPVDVYGFAASRGVIYATGQGRATLYLSRDNRASFYEPLGEVYNAISGGPMLVQEGRVVATSGGMDGEPHPRTAIALDQESRRLIVVVVDGRQPNYSEGVSLVELAGIIIEFGGYTALNLDGGGSTTLAAEGASGQPLVLNSPIDNYIPGRERPVANHLGVYALSINVEE
jgi:hypothetical protein